MRGEQIVKIKSNNQPPPIVANTTKEELKKIFVREDDEIVNNGKCEWKCRDVKSGYTTQIIRNIKEKN